MEKILNLQKSDQYSIDRNKVQSNLSIGCLNRSNLSWYFC
ncbi:class III lanthipeptide [Lysinibacillus sp. NPDC058147]